MSSIAYTVSNDLCTGCGVCEDVCPSHAIKMSVNQAKFVPVVDGSLCKSDKGCHRCFDACAGVGVNLKQIANKIQSEDVFVSDPYIGNYLTCFTGYSLDSELRYHSASGGVLSQLLIWLLEKKYIDGAVVTKFDSKEKLLVNTFVATTKEEIIQARSSKYAPVSLNHVISDIKQRKGKYVIVGLPCHIQSFRKYEQMDSVFKNMIFAYFGLYCSYGRTFDLTSYVLKKRNVSLENLNYFAYRDEGCLGSMIVKGESTTKHTPVNIKEKFEHYYLPLRAFFVPRRCLLCVDHFSELADVSFGDIHIPPYINDEIGVNSVVVRNEKLLSLIKMARDENYIHLDALSADVLLSSQKVLFQKKKRVDTYLKISKFLGRKTPTYDLNLKDNAKFKSIIAFLHTSIQIYIGKNKCLWFLIDILKK